MTPEMGWENIGIGHVKQNCFFFSYNQSARTEKSFQLDE